MAPPPSYPLSLPPQYPLYPPPTTPAGPEELEMPWWAYGPRGMQLWFPSLLPTAAASQAGGRWVVSGLWGGAGSKRGAGVWVGSSCTVTCSKTGRRPSAAPARPPPPILPPISPHTPTPSPCHPPRPPSHVPTRPRPLPRPLQAHAARLAGAGGQPQRPGRPEPHRRRPWRGKRQRYGHAQQRGGCACGAATHGQLDGWVAWGFVCLGGGERG